METFFVFAGQGAQFPGMGKDLYENSAAARAVFDQADDILGYKLSDICFNGPEDKLTQSIYCQVAIYTVSVACLGLFREKFPDVKPYGCAGLSLGEYAALYAGEAFSFETGLNLLKQRAKFMDEACRSTDGAMASVLGGDAQIITEVCAECSIFVANYNSPGQIVISGEKSKLEEAVAILNSKGFRKVIMLNVAGAFHSGLMASAGAKLREVLANAPIEMPQIPVYQNFSSEPPADIDMLKSNLADQVAGSVLWEQSVRKLAARGGVMVEFGPGNVLANLMRRTLPEVKTFSINGFESLNSVSW